MSAAKALRQILEGVGGDLNRGAPEPGGVIRFAPGEVQMDAETGEFTRSDDDGPRWRIRFYEGDLCWGAEFNQSTEQIANLLALWADSIGPGEHAVIEQGDER